MNKMFRKPNLYDKVSYKLRWLMEDIFEIFALIDAKERKLDTKTILEIYYKLILLAFGHSLFFLPVVLGGVLGGLIIAIGFPIYLIFIAIKKLLKKYWEYELPITLLILGIINFFFLKWFKGAIDETNIIQMIILWFSMIFNIFIDVEILKTFAKIIIKKNKKR